MQVQWRLNWKKQKDEMKNENSKSENDLKKKSFWKESCAAEVTVHLLPRRHLGHEEHQLSANNAGMLQHTHKNANKHTRVNNQASVRAQKRNSQLAVKWERPITKTHTCPAVTHNFTHFKCQCWRILVQFCITARIFSHFHQVR